MYEVTWIYAGKPCGICTPSRATAEALFVSLRAARECARLWDRSVKGAPALIF